MIEDLKIVLTYVSIELMYFIITALKKALLFFAGLVIIISTFFIGLKSGLTFLIVIIISISLIILLHILKNIISIKPQFNLNYNFVKFLLKDKNINIENTSFSKTKLNIAKAKLTKNKNLSALKRTVLAFYTTSINKEDIFTNYNKNLKKEIIKIHIAGYGLFFIFIFFFELISLGLAFGNNIQNDFMIFLAIIGFIFAYALFSIIIDPLMYLLIQKKVIEN